MICNTIKIDHDLWTTYDRGRSWFGRPHEVVFSMRSGSIYMGINFPYRFKRWADLPFETARAWLLQDIFRDPRHRRAVFHIDDLHKPRRVGGRSPRMG